MSSVAEKLAKKSSKKSSSRQVRLKLVYIDFWSAVKLSFLAAVAIAIITIVFFFLVFTVLEAVNVFGSVNALYSEFAGGSGDGIGDLFTIGRVMGFAVVIAILNLIVVTVLGAVAAGLYNLAVKISGGLLVGFTNQ